MEQDLPSLKEIKLRHCRQLIEMPNLSSAPNLERIDLVGCISLVAVCPSISCLSKLYVLKLNNCSKITSILGTKCLNILVLSNCLINKFPQVPRTIEYLLLDGTAIQEIPHSIRFLSQLKWLSLHGCRKLKKLPNSGFQLKHLQILVIGDVDPSQYENNIILLPSLQSLHLYNCELESIPSCIQQMSCLVELHLISCKRLQSLPNLPPNLNFLNVLHCTSLKVVSNSVIGLQGYWGKFMFAGCTNLSQKEIRSIFIHAQQRILLLAHTCVDLSTKRLALLV